MKKRILSILLTLCLLLPVGAGGTSVFAADAMTRDIVLVLDVSTSMIGTPFTTMKTAAKQFCQAVLEAPGENRIAIATYSNTTQTVGFSSNYTALANYIDSLTTRSGTTNIGGGYTAADSLLSSSTAQTKNIVLLTDGLPEGGDSSATGPYTSADSTHYQRANSVYNTYTALEPLYNIYTVGFFHNLTGQNLAFGRRLLNDVQDSGYFEATAINDLLAQLLAIADDILYPVNLALSHTLVDQKEYIKDYTSGTFMTRHYYFEISASVTNGNAAAIEGLRFEIDLPSNMSLSGGESAVITYGDLAASASGSVTWKAEYICINTSSDVNLEYTVAAKSNNTVEFSNYGNIFVHGYNENNNILDFSKDTWKFKNYGETPIPILSGDLNAFKYGFSNADKEAIDTIISNGADGQCAGMAITSVLAKVNRLNLAGAANLHAVDKNDNSKSTIAYYYLSQFLTPYQDNKRDFATLSVQQRLERIAELADAVDSGGTPFVMMLNTEANGGGHAVTAYSFEHGSFRVGGFLGMGGTVYNRRVLIYDNNSPSWDKDFCLYFNEGTDEWTIPGYSNASALTGAFSDINLMDASSLEMNKKNVQSSVRARQNTDIIISTAQSTATLSQIMNNLISGVVAVFDDGGDVEAVNIYFDNSEQAFTIKPQIVGAPLDLSINYDNYYMAAKVPAKASAVDFNPSGVVGIKGNVDDFNLVLTGNQGYHALPWYTIKVAGDHAQSPSLSKASNGYLLTGIQTNSITVSGKNDEEIKQLSFTTDKDTVFIGELDGKLAAYVDNDGDGKHETLLATSSGSSSPSQKWWEKLPCWLQWILRYILFGWIWMNWF